MELCPLSASLLLIVLLQCGQTEENPKPTVRLEPQSPVYTGDTVTLTCELQTSPTGWKFLWYKNNQHLHPHTHLQNTNTITITVSNTGADEYRCIAYSEETHYTDYSDTVKITVRERPKPKVKVRVRVEPQSTVYTRDTVTLTCELQTSLTGWKFLWYKNSQSMHLTAVNENANTITITVSNRGTEEYKCSAYSEETHYTDYSDTVKITVRERPKPKVKVQPTEHVFIRESVTLTCDIESGGVWRYEWFRNNKRLGDAQWRRKYEISNVD